MKRFTAFVLLLLIWAGCFALTGFVAIALGSLPGGTLDAGEYLRLLQWLQTILVMIVPPLLWVKLVLKEPVSQALRLGTWSWRHVGLAMCAMALAAPAMEWLGVATYLLPWPEALRELAEGQATSQAGLMMQMFDLPGVWGFVRIALLVSLATAVGEELLFRGAFMRLLGTAHIHWVALLIGFVFAMVHLEVYGLFARWLLGAAFVYLVYWTRSLWPAVAAHATNNLIALIEFKADPEAAQESVTACYFPLWIAVVGMVAASLVMVAIRRSGKDGVEA